MTFLEHFNELQEGSSDINITSLAATSEQIGREIHRHWQIENREHWILDEVMREYDSHLSADSGPGQYVAVSLRRFEPGVIIPC